MMKEKKFLVDVGMRDLPFPIKVASRDQKGGQATVGNISIHARIMHEFEAGWIDKFINIVHNHRDRIGTDSLRTNILDYLKDLEASYVRVDFDYPFFVEKRTPVKKEKCLVKHNCTFSAKVPSLDKDARIFFKIDVPCITTYPGSSPDKKGGLLGQLTHVIIETESVKDVYPETFVELVDSCALSPIYSFLTPEDQDYVIGNIHTNCKTSVVMANEIKEALARDKSIDWYSVKCSNYGVLHSYTTVIGTEKSMWVPSSSFDDSDI
jgi:GTP cyclohydrolase IB